MKESFKAGDIVQVKRGALVIWRNKVVSISKEKCLTIRILDIKNLTEAGNAEVVCGDGNILVGDSVGFLLKSVYLIGNDVTKPRGLRQNEPPKI